MTGCCAHQNKRFSWCELHAFGCGAVQTPFDWLEHGQGSAHALEQNLAGVIHLDFPELEAAGACSPSGSRGQLEGWICLRLQKKAKWPKFLIVCWGCKLQTGAGSSHISSNPFTPMIAGSSEAFGFFIAELKLT